jgi:hypothetical protein
MSRLMVMPRVRAAAGSMSGNGPFWPVSRWLKSRGSGLTMTSRRSSPAGPAARKRQVDRGSVSGRPA